MHLSPSLPALMLKICIHIRHAGLDLFKLCIILESIAMTCVFCVHAGHPRQDHRFCRDQEDGSFSGMLGSLALSLWLMWVSDIGDGDGDTNDSVVEGLLWVNSLIHLVLNSNASGALRY